MLVISLWGKGEVTGTLKIYYRRGHRITGSLQEMAIGLSQITSTQLEMSRAAQLHEIASVDEDLHFSLPSLLTQPLVENAIVHGIQPCRGKGVVMLSVQDLG